MVSDNLNENWVDPEQSGQKFLPERHWGGILSLKDGHGQSRRDHGEQNGGAHQGQSLG